MSRELSAFWRLNEEGHLTRDADSAKMPNDSVGRSGKHEMLYGVGRPRALPSESRAIYPRMRLVWPKGRIGYEGSPKSQSSGDQRTPSLVSTTSHRAVREKGVCTIAILHISSVELGP